MFNFLAPGMATIFWFFCNIQAREICAGVAAFLLAKLFNKSRSGSFESMFFSSYRLITLLASKPSNVLLEVIFPDKKPPASGEKATNPIFKSLQSGMISFSNCLAIIEYSLWIQVNGVILWALIIS